MKKSQMNFLILYQNSMIKNGPALISNIMLGSTNVIDENDFIVRPIAIYYELK